MLSLAQHNFVSQFKECLAIEVGATRILEMDVTMDRGMASDSKTYGGQVITECTSGNPCHHMTVCAKDIGSGRSEPELT